MLISVLAVSGSLLLAALMPLTEWGLRQIGRTECNFRGDRIPQSVGLVILFWSAGMLGLLAGLRPELRPMCLLWATASVGFGLLGFIDDTWGTRQIKGLRGHFQAALRDHRITTGFVKAVAGASLALWLAAHAERSGVPSFLPPGLSFLFAVFTQLIMAGVIALGANAINLLDLRPGRAGGSFLLISLPLLITAWAAHQSQGIGLLLVAIPAAAVWMRDSRAKVMLGDTGSNLLGGALGLAIVTLSPPEGQLLALLLLIALHITAERVSLTALIERTPVLRSLDRLTGVR